MQQIIRNGQLNYQNKQWIFGNRNEFLKNDELKNVIIKLENNDFEITTTNGVHNIFIDGDFICELIQKPSFPVKKSKWVELDNKTYKELSEYFKTALK